MKNEVMHPLIELIIARVKETIREPEVIFWVFFFPVLLAFALGIAFREKPEPTLRVAVLNQVGMEDVVKVLSRSPNLSAVMVDQREASSDLRAGRVDIVIGRADENSPTPALAGKMVFTYDPARSESEIARLAVHDALERGLGREDLIAIEDHKVTAPGTRYIDFLIPGLIGMNLMGSGMWGVGFAVVLARTRKLLKRLAATPMRRSHYLLGFMLSRLLFLAPEVAALALFGWVIFKVKVYGSVLDLAIVSVLGGLTFAGMGLLVASRSKTVEAVSGWMNFIMLPMYLLSGSFFSYERFPKIAIPFIRGLPLTALNDALRAVINEGKPLTASWVELGVLSLWGLASFAVALRIFRWQ